jgi:hypothetical protein
VGVDSPYPLTPGRREAYARDGFVRLPGVFDAGTLEHVGPELSAKVVELNTLHRPMEERGGGGREDRDAAQPRPLTLRRHGQPRAGWP